MNSLLVKEYIDFKRGQDSKKSLSIGLEGLKNTIISKVYVESKVEELRGEGFDVTFQINEYNGDIYELDIDELDDHDNPDGKSWMVSFLNFDQRKWFDKKSEIWGWGIWDQIDGDVHGEYGLDWETVKKEIYKLADRS